MERISISDLTVLVVEPSGVQSQIIRKSLAELEVQAVEVVHDAGDALKSMRTTPPDLVISAMYLPDRTATEMILEMRGDSRLEEVPFMLISSETAFRALDPIRQAGVVAILPKPFRADELRRALHATLDFIEPERDLGGEIELDDIRVLVVDDSTTARKHISRVLQKLGIEQISQAENGREAVEMIQSNFYDLVVTDFNMPEMDGEMLTRYIRERSDQRAIPILMVTSEGDDNRLAAVQRAGVSGICDKPFETGAVREMISQMMA